MSLDPSHTRPSGSAPLAAPNADERRAARRVSTLREAVFEALIGKPLSRDGTVVDLSHDGLQLRTRTPAPVGERLLIEVDPKPGDPASTPIKTEGRVVWCRELAGGEWAMGIRMRHETHAPVEAVLANLAAVADHGSVLSGRLSPEPPLPGSAASESARPARFRTAGGDTKRRRRVLLAILLGILCALLLFLFLGRTLQDTLFHGRLGPRSSEAPAAKTAEPPPGIVPPEESGPEPGGRERPLASQTPGVLPGRVEPRAPHVPNAAPAGNANTQGDMARPFDSLTESETPAGRVFAALEAAGSDTAPEEPRRPGPLLVADEPVEGQGGAGSEGPHQEPEPAQPAGGSRGQGSGASESIPAEVAAILKAHEQQIPGEGLSILVDKAAYTMVLLMDGQPLRWFPVGLGKDDSTPEGAFVIANKIANPDWFDHGRTVKAGDPENPLGASWMGLGDGQPMSVGIHPTNDLDSIGQAASRGCIRMRPDDAKAVFRLCPVGTPVYICKPESGSSEVP